VTVTSDDHSQSDYEGFTPDVEPRTIPAASTRPVVVAKKAKSPAKAKAKDTVTERSTNELLKELNDLRKRNENVSWIEFVVCVEENC
jgi:hypothetical protein